MAIFGHAFDFIILIFSSSVHSSNMPSCPPIFLWNIPPNSYDHYSTYNLLLVAVGIRELGNTEMYMKVFEYLSAIHLHYYSFCVVRINSNHTKRVIDESKTSLIYFEFRNEFYYKTKIDLEN